MKFRINYQYEAVSFVKSETQPKSKSRGNSLSYYLENSNVYHINNLQIIINFDFVNQPYVNQTVISPENYEITSKNNRISSIIYNFFEIKENEDWLLYIKFNEVVYGCLDSKVDLYNNEQNDMNYMTGAWIVLFIFFFFIMLILYCGEISNLKKKR